MLIERDRCRNTPRWCQGILARSSERDPVRGLHQGQRSQAPRQQAGHMTAPRKDQLKLNQPLRKRSRPHMTAPMGLIFTLVSVGRYYALRRTFEWLAHRSV